MSKVKLLPILIFVALFAYLLSLPSAKTVAPQSEIEKQISSMPVFDFIKYGKIVLERGNPSKALSIFAIAMQNDATRDFARKEIKESVEYLKSQNSTLAKLELVGNLFSKHENSWDADEPNSIAAFLTEENINKLSKELLFDNNNFDDFLVTLRNVGSITEVMPKSRIAFDLLKIAESTNILTEELKSEIIHSIKAYNKSDVISPERLGTVLDEVIPTLQLMKKCDTWNQFATLMSNVKSSRHVSILLNLINSAEKYPNKSINKVPVMLTELLLAAGSNSELKSAILGYVNDKGVAGLNNLYRAISKGAVALKLLTDNPNVIISGLNNKVQNSGDPIREWWIRTAAMSPYPMELVRYILMALSVTAIILCGAQSQHLARVMLIKEPENATSVKVAMQLFAVVFCIFALCFIFNTFLKGAPVKVGVRALSASGEQTQNSASSATISQQNTLTGVSILSLVIILFMQFTVYAKAISELKKIKELSGSASLKLKQLKHADIFLDLPIYLGLLGTVSSFIIMLFDPTASRIVAYSSTIIGIIFSASLRIFYAYPFQKELTNEAENQTGEVVD